MDETRAALMLELTTACQSMGVRASDLDGLINRPGIPRITRQDQQMMLRHQLRSTLSMINVLNMFSTHLSALEEASVEKETGMPPKKKKLSLRNRARLLKRALSGQPTD